MKISKAQKYEEVFGLPADKNMCPTSYCEQCPIRGKGCGATDKWWDEEYKEPEEANKPKKGHATYINHVNDNGHNIADCSVCGHAMQWHDEDEDGVPRFCWFCGAKIDGVED